MYALPNKQALNTILAALRFYQQAMQRGEQFPPEIEDIASDSDTDEELDFDGIDQLAMDLNDSANTILGTPESSPVRTLLMDIRDAIAVTDPEHPEHNDSGADFMDEMCKLLPRIEQAIGGALSAPGEGGTVREMSLWEQSTADAGILVSMLRHLHAQARPVAAILLLDLIQCAANTQHRLENLADMVNMEANHG